MFPPCPPPPSGTSYRPTMNNQDRYDIRQSTRGLYSFGVFDGHGKSASSAQLCAEKLLPACSSAARPRGTSMDAGSEGDAYGKGSGLVGAEAVEMRGNPLPLGTSSINSHPRHEPTEREISLAVRKRDHGRFQVDQFGHSRAVHRRAQRLDCDRRFCDAWWGGEPSNAADRHSLHHTHTHTDAGTDTWHVRGGWVGDSRCMVRVLARRSAGVATRASLIIEPPTVTVGAAGGPPRRGPHS